LFDSERFETIQLFHGKIAICIHPSHSQPAEGLLIP